MDAERWRKIEAIYEAALAVEPCRRAALLEESCAGDESLRRELESLLAHLVQRGYVGVVQGGDGPRLALEALAELGFDELQSHAAAQAGVAGLVHHSHPALAELLLNLVVRDTTANGHARRLGSERFRRSTTL